MCFFKKISLLVSLFCIVVFLVSCSHRQDRTLYIYNWTYYMPDKIIRDFEKKFNVKVVYDVYSSNEEMFAKLKAGATGYDLVFPSGDYIQIMIRENMLFKIDHLKIPNLKYLDPQVLDKIHFDPQNQYSVPYMMAAAGISVNKQLVKNYEHSSSIFDRKDLNGKMTLLDDMREVLGLALKRLGYSVNTTDNAQLEAAKNVVLKWKDNILKFDAEGFAKGFSAGEYWVVQGYAESIFLEMDSSQMANVDFFIPKEGGPMYIDNMAILKDAKHVDLAYQFINYIHTPEVYAQIADYLRLPAINMDARKLITKKPHYQIEDLDHCEIKEDLGSSLQLYNKIWEQIRI